MPPSIDALAVAWVVLRTACIACCLADRPAWRSMQFASLACVIGLFMAAAVH